MLDGVLVTNEVIHEARAKRKPCVIFKIDFEKAYDSVSWEFLCYMMERMGFGWKWQKWIKGCLESATMFVLVNGSSTSQFEPERGLRQGDSLAHFLFMIVTEGLNALMQQAV